MVPMSQEQLEFFSNQTRRAVHKAVGKYVRGAVVGFLVLLAGIGFALHQQNSDAASSRHAVVQSGRAVAVASCNGRYQDREGLRNILIAGESQIGAATARGEITVDQAQRAKTFYDSQLAKLALPDCRSAASIITDDPATTVRIPAPLHPPERTLLPHSFHDSIADG